MRIFYRFEGFMCRGIFHRYFFRYSSMIFSRSHFRLWCEFFTGWKGAWFWEDFSQVFFQIQFDDNFAISFQVMVRIFYRLEGGMVLGGFFTGIFSGTVR